MVQLQRVAPVTAALKVRAPSRSRLRNFNTVYRPYKKKTKKKNAESRKNVRLLSSDWTEKVNLMLGNAEYSSFFFFILCGKAAAGDWTRQCLMV